MADVLNLDNFEVLWDNINEKFARKTDNTIPTRVVFAFKSSKTRPGKPIGGSWNNITNEIVYPKNHPDDVEENTWGPSDDIERPVWMSMKTFATEKIVESDWSEPTMISGEDGAPGADGINREFVYKRTEDEFKKPGGDDPNYALNLPSDQVNGFVPDGWTANPTGVDEEWKVEWQLTRTKLEDGSWSKWSGPTMWSKFGVNGQDGDSVEYIYRVTDVAIAPEIITIDIESDQYQSLNQYQGIEYVPQGWSDNPVGVDDVNMWEWVSQRKKKDNKWGKFSDPSLWAKYGETGQSGYSIKNYYTKTDKTSDYDYVRSLIDDYRTADPGDLPSSWSASLPIDYDRDEEVIWSIIGTINTVNNTLVDGTEWEGPILISGTIGKDANPNYPITLFCQWDSIPTPPSTGMEYVGNPIDVHDGDNVFTWSPTPTNTDGRWWVVSGVVNGVSNLIDEIGAVKPYNGLDGEALPGVFTEYRFKASDNQDKPVFIDVDEEGNIIWEPEGWELVAPDVVQGGSIWQIWGIKDPNTKQLQKLSNDKYWQGPVRMSGEPGESIIGDPGPSGIPGSQYENRFMLGNEDGPMLPWDEDMTHVPDPVGWNKSMPTPEGDLLYIWCIQGRMVYNEDTRLWDKLDEDGWEPPFRLSGLNGLDGKPGETTLLATLDNPMDSVVAEKDYTVTEENLNIKTTFHVYEGTKDLPITSMRVDEELNGVDYTIDGATLTVNAITNKDTKVTIPLIATVEKENGEIAYKQVFIINKVIAGAPTFVVDFGNDNITVPTDTDGMLIEGTYPIQTSLHVYLGTTELSDISLEVLSFTNAEFADGKKYVELVKQANYDNTVVINGLPSNIFNGDVEILKFKVSGISTEGVTYSKNVELRLVKVKQGRDSIIYELMPNTNAIRFTTDSKYEPESLKVNIMKKLGGSEANILTLDQISGEGLGVRYSIDDGSFENLTSDLTLSGLDLETKIELELFNTENTVLDKETMYLLHDGLPAVRYYIQLNRDVVQYDQNQKVTDNTPIVCELVKVDGSEYSKPSEVPMGFDLKYSIDGGSLKDYIIGEELEFNVFDDNLTFYLFSVANRQDNKVLIDQDAVIAMKVAQGERGRVVFPAGTYNVEKIYTTNGQRAPYVFDPKGGKEGKGGYYLLAKEFDWCGLQQNNRSPKEDIDDKGTDSVWEEFEMFEAIYAEIGIFGNALVGSAVFNNEYVFSQMGRDRDGNSTTAFEGFCEYDITNPYSEMNNFYPNVCINFGTGEVWIGGQEQGMKFIKNPDTGNYELIMGSKVSISWGQVQDAEELENILKNVESDANTAAVDAESARQKVEEIATELNAMAEDGVISFLEQKELLKKGNEMHREYTQLISDINKHNNDVESNWEDSWKERFKDNEEKDEKTDYIVDSSSFIELYIDVQDSIEYHSDSVFDSGIGEYIKNEIDEDNQELLDSHSIPVDTEKYQKIYDFYTQYSALVDNFSKKVANLAEALSNIRTGTYFTQWSDDNLINEQEMNNIKDELDQATKEHNQIKSDYNTVGGKLLEKLDYDSTNNAVVVNYRNAWSAYEKTMTYYSSTDGKTEDQIEIFDDKKFIKVTQQDGSDGDWDNIDNYFSKKQSMINEIARLNAKVAEESASEEINSKFEDLTADGWVSTVEQNALKLKKDEIIKEYDKIKKDIDDYNTKVGTGNVNSGESSSEYRVSDSAISSFTSAKNNAVNAINYHIGLEWVIGDKTGTQKVDEIKGVEINETYWGYISAFYTVKNQILDDFNSKQSAFALVSRMGSKWTKLSETGIYTGTLVADNIIGWRIKGLSLESSETGTLPSDFTWWSWKNIDKSSSVADAKEDKKGGTGPRFQFRSDGSGHMATGNIWWDTVGNLNVKGKVNGLIGSTMGPWKTFTSGSVNYIADGESTSASKNYFGSDGSFGLGGTNGITKNANGNIQFGNTNTGFSLDTSGKLIFGKDVTLSWSKIDGAAAGVNNALTSDAVNSKVTSISGTAIQTGTLDADKIKAGSIDVEQLNMDSVSAGVIKAQEAEIEKIAAGSITAIDITTDKLSTTGYEGGKPNIKDGTIFIQGNDMGVYDASAREILRITGDDEEKFASNTSINTIGLQRGNDATEVGDEVMNAKICNLSSLVEGVEYTCNDVLNFYYEVSDPTENDTNNPHQEGYAGVNYVIYYGTDNEWQNGQADKLLSSNDYFDYFIDDSGNYSGQGSNNISLNFIHRNGANLYVKCNCASIATGGSLTLSHMSTSLDFIPIINKTTINSTGICLRKDGEHYIKLNYDGTCEMICGNYGLKVTSSGIKQIYNGKEYSIPLS